MRYSALVLLFVASAHAQTCPLRPATPVAALPTAASTYRGITVYQEGAGGVADTIVCCMKDSAGNYSWKVVATG